MTARISLPQPDDTKGSRSWVCTFRLGAGRKSVWCTYGATSMQALCLAVDRMRAELEDQRPDLDRQSRTHVSALRIEPR